MTRGLADIHSIPQKSETNHTLMQPKQAIDSRESRHSPARTLADASSDPYKLSIWPPSVVNEAEVFLYVH